jgi:ssDNA-binding Zn-finger/Zn-ribbon topoisomerase 1
MKTKGFWVIKTSGGGYWSSGGFDPQIRKAHVYTWKEKAEEMIEVMIKRKYLPPEITYEVVAIAEPKELKDTEAKWQVSGMFDDFLKCSNCGESWPWQTAEEFRFCPHCGKRMINSTMPEDD